MELAERKSSVSSFLTFKLRETRVERTELHCRERVENDAALRRATPLDLESDLHNSV